jgi:Tfp pilus assembly protein PilX
MNSAMRRQKGATLLVGLIMLVLLTLMAITSFNLGKSNMQIVGNMQFRNETVRAAEEAVEAAISLPNSVIVPTVYNIDINANGTPDVAITITPTLQQAYVKKNNALVLSDPDQLGCTLGQAQAFGVVGAATGNSLCAATLYDLKVVAREAATNTSVELHQGVAVQVPADTVCAVVAC